jgi:chorismate mutase
MRLEIDDIDSRILEQLVSRRKIVSRLIRKKSSSESSLRNVRREEEILSRLIGLGIGKIHLTSKTGGRSDTLQGKDSEWIDHSARHSLAYRI